MKIKKYIFIIVVGLILSCNVPKDADEIYIHKPHLDSIPEVVIEMMNHHGGYDQWIKFDHMTYVLDRGNPSKNEVHHIDLHNRKTLIEGKGYQVGFDGQEVWVAPDKGSFEGNPIFYYNLYFYFHALPFLVADPGVHFEDLGDRMEKGQNYKAISITYGSDIGVSPEDEYILLLNHENGRLEKILYTVTYYSGEKTTRYNALEYGDWNTVEGILLPGKITGYIYNEGEWGEKRYEAFFREIVLSEAESEEGFFARPEIAEVAE